MQINKTIAQTVTYEFRLLVGHDLVENMVTPLWSQLKRNSGFFQQIYQKKQDSLHHGTLTTQYCMSHWNLAHKFQCLRKRVFLWFQSVFLWICPEREKQVNNLGLKITNSVMGNNKVLISSLTNREELSFLTVLAFPKASSRGLAEMIWSSRLPYSSRKRML